MKSLILKIILCLLVLSSACLFILDLNLKASIVKLGDIKEEEFQNMLAKERIALNRQVESKYHNDMLAFRALAKKQAELKKQNILTKKLNK